MKAIVDADLCIGCGMCAETCPDVFEMDNNVAIVKTTAVSAEAEKFCREAKDICPVEAISVEE